MATKKSPRKKSSAKKSSSRKSAAKKSSSTRSSSRRTSAKKSSSKKKSSRRYSPSAGKNVETEMHEMKRGKLKSGHSGKRVRNPKQAIAIGLSKARKAGAKVPKKS
ncbi:MAG TPA: DUF6496 domain-containing protein [Terracidiphilus sp.]|nr:DUF6496 domain-containing protein [Terracidiphilus sp.]